MELITADGVVAGERDNHTVEDVTLDAVAGYGVIVGAVEEDSEGVTLGGVAGDGVAAGSGDVYTSTTVTLGAVAGYGVIIGAV